MTAILATVIFLLSDGMPAKKAFVSCTGVPVFEAGNDNETGMPEGTPLIVDSRGAIIIQANRPTTIHCDVWHGGQSFTGPIALINKAVEVVVLK